MRYVRAFLLGIHDGWSQPYEVSTSYNVDHLIGAEDRLDVYEVQDWGINVGQFLRAGRRSESYVKGFFF